jgi:protein O-mannosyl-transferase
MSLFRNTWFCYIFISALVLILYFPILSSGFVWDDYGYIVNNPFLGQGSSFLNLWLHKVTVDFWPLSYSYFWVLKYFFTDNAWPYHVASLGVFLVSVLLLYSLLLRLNVKSAFWLALIFTVHPMNVEVATWIFQAKTNLANVFGLLSFIFLIKYFEKKKIINYLAAFLCLALSFLSKISLVMLPVVFLFWFYRSEQSKTLKNYLLLSGFFVLSAVFGLANIFWDQNALPVPPSEMIISSNWLFRFLLLGQNFLFYLTQSFWPLDLMFVHPRLDPDLNSILYYAPLLLVLTFLTTASVYLYKKPKGRFESLFLGWSFAFIFLFPVLGLFEIYFQRFSYVSEHYLTLGLIGFVYPLVDALNRLHFGRVILCALVALLSLQSLHYEGDWQSEKILLEANIQKGDHSILPHNILGLFYKNQNNFEKALWHYDRSNEIHPNAASYYNKAFLLAQTNQLEAARENYEKSIELNPYVAGTYTNLAVVQLKLNHFELALSFFNKALSMTPLDPACYYNLGYAYEQNKNFKQAHEWYLKALQLAPQNELFKEAVGRVTN